MQSLTLIQTRVNTHKKKRERREKFWNVPGAHWPPLLTTWNYTWVQHTQNNDYLPSETHYHLITAASSPDLCGVTRLQTLIETGSFIKSTDHLDYNKKTHHSFFAPWLVCVDSLEWTAPEEDLLFTAAGRMIHRLIVLCWTLSSSSSGTISGWVCCHGASF